MVMKRAYSVLTVKSIDEDKGEIRGIATTPSVDSYGDIVEPKGAKYKLPIPLLWQHQNGEPIGTVEKATVTKDGIEVVAKIARGVTDRIDEAWTLIKAGLVRGLSIGFKPDEYVFMENGGMRISAWTWLELSAVTIPANSDATIQSVKSADRKTLAALGNSGSKQPAITGATQRGHGMKTIRERIAEFEAVKAQHAARVKELTSPLLEGEGVLTDEDQAALTENTDAIKALDSNIAALKAAEAVELASAQSVTKVAGLRQVPGAGISFVRKADPDEKFAGQNFTRKVIAKAVAFMSQGDLTTGQVAEMRWGKTHPQLVQTIKAAVPGGGTGTGEWGAELAASDSRYAGDFIEYLRGQTVYDKLPLREIPPNVMVKGQDGGATGYMVGESKAIPMSRADFMSVELRRAKVAGLTTLSRELLEDSSPSAELLVRDDLTGAVAERMDTLFLSAVAAVAGVSPAGILNGLAAIPSSGDSADHVRLDIFNLGAPFRAARNASGLWLVTSTDLLEIVSSMRSALDQYSFPEIAQGRIGSKQIVAGDHVPANHLIMLKPSDIYKIGDDGLQFAVSRDATIEQDNAPTGASDTPTAASANMVNMFQSDSVAIRVTRSFNYAKRRASAVSFINDASYLIAEPATP